LYIDYQRSRRVSAACPDCARQRDASSFEVMTIKLSHSQTRYKLTPGRGSVLILRERIRRRMQGCCLKYA
jgi:hypothetical protein